jgi:hypothetical protein
MRRYLVETFLKNHFRKPLWGSSYIYFNDFQNQSAILTNYSLAIGLLFKNDFGLLLELLGNAKSEIETNIKGLNEIAERMEKELSSDVVSTFDLFSEIETKETIRLFFNDKNIDYRNPHDLLKIKNEKIPTKVAVTMTEMLIYKMIGFSYRYADKTEKLLSYKVNEHDYKLALKSGLDIPEVQEVLTIEDHLNFAKELIRPYISQVRPDLINQLRL